MGVKDDEGGIFLEFEIVVFVIFKLVIVYVFILWVKMIIEKNRVLKFLKIYFYSCIEDRKFIYL